MPNFKLVVYSTPQLNSANIVGNVKTVFGNTGTEVLTYMPARRLDGKVVPVQVKYFGQLNGNQKAVIFRPSALEDKDAKLPLNPIATNPNKKVTHWFEFNKGRVLDSNSFKDFEIIKDFYRLECTDVKFYPESKDWKKSKLIAHNISDWNEYASQWMVGDKRNIGIRLYPGIGDKKWAGAYMTCYAKIKDPNIAGSNYQKAVTKGFTVIDLDNTVAGTEKVELQLFTGDRNIKYYPTDVAMNCSKYNLEQLGNEGIKVEDKGVQAWAELINYGTDTGIRTNSSSGICQKVYGSQYGLTGDGSVMAVAPVYAKTQVDQQVAIWWSAVHSESLAFGMIDSIDSSNADFNNGMPPVYQQNSVEFYGGKAVTVSDKTDWALPENYKQNVYYFGSRLGKTVNPIGWATDNRGLRDGSGNDGIATTQPVPLKRGSDKTARIQPRIKPGDNYLVAGTVGDKKYLASQEAFEMTTSEAGAELKQIPRPENKLTVNVSCGKSTEETTWVRGWADFNGNGVFDPGEASDRVTCGKDSVETVKASAQSNLRNSQMPTTGTEQVTLTFDYPMHNDLRGKRDVWMRVRAVGDKDANILNKTATKAVTTHASNPIRNKPDPGTETQTSSAEGSWAFSSTGETEDYLFSITPKVDAANDSFCLAKGKDSVTVDVIANDMETEDVDPVTRKPWREPNLDSLVFVAGQSGVTITKNGKKAVRSGEGTYEVISGGKIRFTPESAVAAEVQNLSAGASPIVFEGIRYAFNTIDNKVYDRVLAGNAFMRGIAEFSCKPQALPVYWGEYGYKYRWDVGTKVLKDDSAATAEWVGNGNDSNLPLDSRSVPNPPESAKVPLTYWLDVKAKRDGKVFNTIKGEVSLMNPTNSAVTTAKQNGVTLSVTGENGRPVDVTCTLDQPTEVNNLKLLPPKKAADGSLVMDTVTKKFTCQTSTLTAMPNLTVTPHLNLQETTSVTNVQVENPLSEKFGGGGVNTKASILDTLTISTTLNGRPIAPSPLTFPNAETDTPQSSGKLKDIVLSAEHIVGSGENAEGSVWVKIKVPTDKQPPMPTEAEGKLYYVNEVKLCDGDSAYNGGCQLIPKILKEGDPTNAKAISEALVSMVTRSALVAADVYLLKVDYSSDIPQKDSEFKLYADNNGEVGVELGEKLVRNENPSTNAQFKLTGLETGRIYWLEETKAPEWHILLPEKIKFTVEDNSGKVTFLSGQSSLITFSYEGGAQLPTIKVRDPEMPVLPASGGRGVIYALGMGTLFMMMALVFKRRQDREII